MKRNLLKSILVSVLCMLSIFSSQAQNTVTFTANNLDGEEALLVNLYLSDLLTAFNEAKNNNTLPDIDDPRYITREAWANVKKTWETAPFVCLEPSVVLPAELSTVYPDEYEIRHIPLRFLIDKDDQDSWRNYQEATVRIGKNSKITYFALSINPENYSQVMANAQNVTEIEQYSLILDYLERFRNAYCLKDINFLEQVYSDDALIITGNVIRTKESKVKITYKKYSKTQYITHLRDVFRKNEKINVTFDSISVKRHPAIEGIYGVQLFQGYTSTRYSDEGYLFLLWDFRNPEMPQIHIRTWQDARIWADNPDEERYDIESFDINDF